MANKEINKLRSLFPVLGFRLETVLVCTGKTRFGKAEKERKEKEYEGRNKKQQAFTVQWGIPLDNII